MAKNNIVLIFIVHDFIFYVFIIVFLNRNHYVRQNIAKDNNFISTFLLIDR